MTRRIAALTLLLTLVLAASAAAKPHKVFYQDKSGYSAAVDLAVAQWNRAQTGIRLVPTTKTKKVVVPIGSYPTLDKGFNAVGGALGIILSQQGMNGFSLPQQATLVSHEIGHALRLDDRPAGSCSVMSASIHDGTLNNDCRPSQALGSQQWRCGANTQDARRLVKLYGGRVRPTTGFCTLPAGALNVTFSGIGAGFSGTLDAIVKVVSNGTASVRASDVGLLVNNSFIPLDGALAPGGNGTITYATCLLPTQGQLYSPTYDTFLGDQITVTSPTC